MYRHKDASEEGPIARCVTILYYPNENWEPKDGGNLRAFAESPTLEQLCKKETEDTGLRTSRTAEGETYTDIMPKEDRLVMFLSTWLPHEVLPSFRERYAITIWLRN